MRQGLLITMAFAALAGCATPRGHLRVVHTTDIHGHFADGLVGVASYVDDARTQPLEVLLLDSGDMWSGTLMSDRNEGALGVAAFNAMGYDAAAVGNHEFDYGPVGPDRTGGDDPFAALKARLVEARFPILSANLIDKATGELPDWPNLKASVMIERGGMRVGIVGATTEETASITFPHVGEALLFTDAAEAVTREARALRDRGADAIILVAHIGGSCEGFDDPDDLSSCDDTSELFTLVRALPPGLVDVALGGHTHSPVAHRVNGVVVAHTGANGTHVIDMEIDGSSGEIAVRWGPPKEAKGAGTGPARAALDAVLAPAISVQTRQRDERLGAQVVTEMARSHEESSPVGSFFCDVLLGLHPEREICLLNSGGIRDALPAGEITYGALYDVLPFGNYAATLEISGEVLLKLLRIGTSGGHGVLQVAGVTLTYDPSVESCAEEPVATDRLTSAMGPDGAPIDPSRTYRVITNSFLAAGGDGWRDVVQGLPLGSIRVLEHLLPIREQIGAWLREKRPILNSPDRPVMPTKRVSAVTAPPSTEGRCSP